MNEQTRADIHAAITVLKQKGWTQHTFQNNKGQFCMVGALRMAIFGSILTHEHNGIEDYKWKRGRLTEAYDAVYDVTRVKPEKFNDNKDTRRRHVLAALRKAAA